MKVTTIKLTFETKQKLSDLGKKGMTYEQIINNLITDTQKDDVNAETDTQ